MAAVVRWFPRSSTAPTASWSPNLHGGTFVHRAVLGYERPDTRHRKIDIAPEAVARDHPPRTTPTSIGNRTPRPRPHRGGGIGRYAQRGPAATRNWAAARLSSGFRRLPLRHVPKRRSACQGDKPSNRKWAAGSQEQTQNARLGRRRAHQRWRRHPSPSAAVDGGGASSWRRFRLRACRTRRPALPTCGGAGEERHGFPSGAHRRRLGRQASQDGAHRAFCRIRRKH